MPGAVHQTPEAAVLGAVTLNVLMLSAAGIYALIVGHPLTVPEGDRDSDGTGCRPEAHSGEHFLERVRSELH